MSVSPKSLLTNWAVLIALWAPVYVTLLEHFRLDSHSEPLQWALLIIGASGLGAMLYTCWQASRPPKPRLTWRPAQSASLPGIDRATSRE